MNNTTELELPADLMHKLGFLNSIQEALLQHHHNIATVEDKLNNLVAEILKIIDDQYFIYKIDDCQYDWARVLYETWTDYLEGKNRSLPNGVYEHCNMFAATIKGFVEEIWKKEIATSKRKMEILVYYVLEFLSQNYKILVSLVPKREFNLLGKIIDPDYADPIGLGDLWINFIVGEDKDKEE